MRQNTYTVALYKTGAIVTFPPDSLHFHLGKRGERGIIRDASKRSLIRGAFLMANPVKPWGAMATLTHRLIPKDTKGALRKFLRNWRKTFGRNVQWAWFMEFQKRGAVHFHFFIEKEWLEENHFLDNLDVRQRRKNAQPTILIRGDLERVVLALWLRAIGDFAPQTKRFNRGGILEMLRSSDGAGRYMAAYVGKEEQKQLPEKCEPCGRWWEINPLYKPKPEGFAVARHWPFPFRYKHVYDASLLDDLVCEPRSNLRLPPSPDELGVTVKPPNEREEISGRWRFVSYDHPELDLANQARKKVK